MGRTLRQLREMANNAKSDLQEGLGPEFKDFDVADLNPKTFVRKHLFEDPDDGGLVSNGKLFDDEPSYMTAGGLDYGERPPSTTRPPDRPPAGSPGPRTPQTSSPWPRGRLSGPDVNGQRRRPRPGHCVRGGAVVVSEAR